MFPIVDARGWKVIGEEELGRKPKKWLEDPSGVRWLFKQATVNEHADGTVHPKGDDWAERVVAEVARKLGIGSVLVELATGAGHEGGQRGVIVRSMLAEGETLLLGNQLLEELLGTPIERPQRLDYSVANVARSLVGVEPPDGYDSAFDAWVEYLVMDALVGNTDRHEENWGVIESYGRRRLAPSFDHASSAGFAISNDERRRRLITRDSGYSVDAYGARARSKFEGFPSLLDVALAGLSGLSRRQWASILERVEGLSTILPLLSQVPSSIMTDVEREFAAALFEANRARFLSACSDTLRP